MDKKVEKQINRADSLLRRNNPLGAVLILKKVVEKSPDFAQSVRHRVLNTSKYVLRGYDYIASWRVI